MLKAELRFSDLDGTPELKDGVIVIGESWIRPFRHPALETAVVRTEGQWFAVIRERLATRDGFELPTAEVDGHHYEQCYRACMRWPLDFVLIDVAHDGRRVQLRAGSLGTAPVYCRATARGIQVSWDFADFLTEPLMIDTDIAAHYLALHTFYSARQICAGVTLLTERASFYADPGEARFEYPAAAPAASPVDVLERTELVELFGEVITKVVTDRPLVSERVAVELSGGMDSATVAAAASKALGAIASKGILISGDYRSAQVQRRRYVVKLLGLRDDTIEMEAHLPVVDLRPDTRPREHPLGELYLEAFEALWRSMTAQGHDTLLSGIGGDELFPRYEGDGEPVESGRRELVATAARHAEALLTPKARSAARSLRVDDAPSGFVPATSLLAHVCRAPYLLRRGLWPVNPLSDPRLAALCHRLPVELRQGRALMRDYLHESLGVALFAGKYEKETFEPVLPAVIARESATIAAQLKECALADLRLVERRAVLDLLEHVARTQDVAATAPLAFCLSLERFVRQVGGSG